MKVLMFFLCFLAFPFFSWSSEFDFLDRVSEIRPSKSWKDIRDEGVVKQDLDFSCGAASLATILNFNFGLDVSERDLLSIIDNGDSMASFSDIARASSAYGFEAYGFRSSWEDLRKIKQPVIVYLKYRKTDHFSVLKGLGEDFVVLADPSLGNVSYGKDEFLKMWYESSSFEYKGKFLAVFQKGLAKKGQFFLTFPKRTSSFAEKGLFVHDFFGYK